jgi:hypothetical protein
MKGDNFAKVPRGSIKLPETKACLDYPMLFNNQNTKPALGEFQDYYACKDCDKNVLVDLILGKTAFRLGEILKIQRANDDFQKRYRVVLMTLRQLLC